MVGRGELEGDSEIEISMLVVTEMVPELIPRASHWDLINISMFPLYQWYFGLQKARRRQAKKCERILKPLAATHSD